MSEKHHFCYSDMKKIHIFYEGETIMSLFENDKKPCPICQSPTPKLFPTKIEDKPICKECDNKISMENKLKNALTLDALIEHLAYREKNAQLHSTFSESRKISTGLFGSAVCIDDANRLWYITTGENSPIYHFDDLLSYTLLENANTLESATPKGRQVFHGVLENRSMFDINDSMQRFNNTLQNMNGQNRNTGANGSRPAEQQIPAPVHTLCLKLNVENPYWKNLEIIFSVPGVFDNDLRRFYVDYQNKLAEAGEFTQAFFSFFPDQTSSSNQGISHAPSAAFSVADELKKFKELLDVGAISQVEFDQKKKELLGM